MNDTEARDRLYSLLEGSMSTSMRGAMELATELIERDNALPPKYYGTLTDTGADLFICPTCEKFMLRRRVNFCPACGQRLEWEEEMKASFNVDKKPEQCLECQFSYDYRLMRWYCTGTKEHRIIEDPDTKPEWCPWEDEK